MNKMAMPLKHLVKTLDANLRPELAQGWDNVGLLIGDPEQAVGRIMLCIDLTREVLREAKARRVQLVLAYHPPIFEPLKRLRADRESVAFEAIRSNIAVYAIHTALDVLPGGTSDALADVIDLRERKPVEPVPATPAKLSKLVVFVPAQAKILEKISLAMFAAGAGQIGQYSCCSFLAPGHGTFLGNPGTHPAVGQAGRFEQVEEMRMEMLVDNDKLPAVVQALRANHPYEEPAYDIYPLAPLCEDLGLGRIGKLPRPETLPQMVALVKRRTGLKKVQIVSGGKTPLTRAAVGPGSCGKMIDQLAGQIDVFITGEIRHHTALAAKTAGISVICLGHGNSERIALPGLQNRLTACLPDLQIDISEKDADPLTTV